MDTTEYCPRMPLTLCPTCRKMLYRTDVCRGSGECGRTDGGSKLRDGSEPIGSHKPEHAGSTPAPATKSPTLPRAPGDKVAQPNPPPSAAPPTKSNSGEAAPRARKRPQPPATQPSAAASTITELREKSAEIINKGGRPRKHPDRKAYKAQKERERRAKQKEQEP